MSGRTIPETTLRVESLAKMTPRVARPRRTRLEVAKPEETRLRRPSQFLLNTEATREEPKTILREVSLETAPRELSPETPRRELDSETALRELRLPTDPEEEDKDLEMERSSPLSLRF